MFRCTPKRETQLPDPTTATSPPQLGTSWVWYASIHLRDRHGSVPACHEVQGFLPAMRCKGSCLPWGASVLACHEVQGYILGRLEFETKFFNEAEGAVQHMYSNLETDSIPAPRKVYIQLHQPSTGKWTTEFTRISGPETKFGVSPFHRHTNVTNPSVHLVQHIAKLIALIGFPPIDLISRGTRVQEMVHFCQGLRELLESDRRNYCGRGGNWTRPP